MATDMDALMEALKKAGSSGISSTPGKPVAAKLSVMKAMPMDGMSDDALGADAGADSGEDESSPEDGQEDERNEQIVMALQTDYPAIYAKLSKQVDGAATPPDDSLSASPPPPAGA